jgi:1,4-alpha-glucan branching enzyme
MSLSGTPQKTTVPGQEIDRILHTDHHDPFQILGPHRIECEGGPAVAIRAFLPDTVAAFVVPSDPGEGPREYPMEKIREEGFFEVVLRGRDAVFPYWLRKVTQGGEIDVFYDSYSFLPTLTDFDLYLFNAGDHHRIYEKLGAHYAEVNGIGGVQFAVWAPGARSVSVIGNFNGWDRRKHAMRVLGSSGIWEIFVPGLLQGELYKFQIKTGAGKYLDKTDPYATEMEVRPRTASVVDFLRDIAWHDEDWLARRKAESYIGKPISVYEVHLGSWRRGEDNRWLSYRELADQLVGYVKEMGYTHIELLPVMEHPLDASWGYQVTGYFAVSSRFGTPADFAHLVDTCHENGIGVILDWVPAHFPKDPHALGQFDGTHLYEHADPRKGEHQDWGTYIFNYGRNEVRNFLISNALFWLEKYHVDGLRIDAVASMLYLDYSRRAGEWIPNQYGGRENLEAVSFLKYLNSIVHSYYPGVLTIAEESTAWPGVTASLDSGGLGFDMKWNMGWMHDMLEYFSKEPIHRSYQHRNLTFVLLYAFHEHFLLPLSHDEVVHGKAALLSKMPGDMWQKCANLRLLFGLMFGFPGKKLLFMGGDFGQWDEWQHEKSIDWNLLEHEPHKGVQRWVKDLNTLHTSEPSLHEVDFHYSGFQWVDFSDSASSIISFERKAYAGRESVYVVCNFTPVPREKHRVGVTDPGQYIELLNSDSAHYGGGNMGNAGGVSSEAVPIHGRPHSLSLTLPPLAVLFLKKKT